MLSNPQKRPSPYEVMRNGGPSPSVVPQGEAGDGGKSRDDEAPADSGNWMARARYPVVLRIPRGYALLMGVAWIGLLVLAYQTGYTRGHRNGEGPGPGSYPPLANQVTEPAPVPPKAPRKIEVPAPVVLDTPTKADIERQVGLNYYVLAHYPRAEAEKLVWFLWEQGVAASAYRPPSKKFFQVITLKGFSRKEIGGAGLNAFREKLHRLGRLWVQQNKQAEDFSQSGIYLAKYKGEQYAEVIKGKTVSR